MRWTTHVVFWLCIWGMFLLASPLLLSMDGQVHRIRDEVNSVTTVFGEAKTTEILTEASTKYKSLFIDTGFLSEKSKLYARQRTTKQEQEDLFAHPTKSLTMVTNGYLQSLSVNVYGLFVRWGITMHWMLFILPFLAAAFLDGFVTRKIKFMDFGFISPMAYSMSLHLIIALSFVPILYLVMPLPISPYFMPGWALVMGFPIILMISNTQRLLNG
jgi:hypothetical protein